MKMNRRLMMLSLLCWLSWVCAARSQEPDVHPSAPSAKQWDVGVEPPQSDAVPPLVAVWSVPYDVLPGFSGQAGGFAEIALTNNIAVVEYCSVSTDKPGCGTHHLLSFDLKTGRFLSSISLPGIGTPGYARLYGGTAKTVLLEYEHHITEYDEGLKPTQDVIRPRGMSLRLATYSYSGIWADLTKTKCLSPDSYALNEKLDLLESCAHEVAVTDKQGRVLFAQTYGDPYAVGVAAISQDGNRFVLGAGLNYGGDPPLHAPVGYLLYDLHDKVPREIFFDIETRTGRKIGPWPAAVGLSPDGTMFGVVRPGKLWMYKLPK
jgi:hypothetical protein